MTVPSICKAKKAVATSKGRGQTPLYHCHMLRKARKYPPKNKPNVGFQKLGGST